MHAIRQRLALWAFMALSALPFASNGAVIPVNDNADYAFGAGPSNDNLVDTTLCTLRKAIQNSIDAAQTFDDCPAGDGNDEITFSDAATIQEGTMGAFPTISSNLTLTGPKTINGNNSGLGNSEIFNVFGNTGTGKLTLAAITLTGAGNSAIRMTGDGSATLTAGGSTFNNNTTGACCGGAISGDGTIALSNVSFTGNTAPSAGAAGGAIHLTSTGFSTITDANFLNNSAADKGGAVYVSLNASAVPTAQLVITNGIFTSNTSSGASSTLGGGAVYAHASGQAFVSLLNCSFISNKADGNDGRGGAIFNEIHDAWPMIVDHGLFSLNSAKANLNSMGGAIYSGDNMIVRASSFIGNDAGPGRGGAIAGNPPAPNGVPTPPTPGMVIANSTIQGNTAKFGGGVYTYGEFGAQKEMKLVNVTIDGNTAATSGGGIYTANVGTGTAVTRIANTIVSNNSGQNCDSTNPPGNSVNSIVGNLTFPGSTCPSDVPITSGDPKLNGPTINLPDVLTLTMSLNAGSAANGTGDNGTCTAPPVFNLDQRSLVAPIRPLGRPNCDIGAYESSRAPGYGSAPAPASTINIVALTGSLATSTVVISETGDDDLKIIDYSVAPNALISVNGTAFPFTMPDGGGTQTLTLTCNTAVPASASTVLTVHHDATGSPATYTVNCFVVDPLSITTASPLASSTVGAPGYSQTLAAIGGTAPYINWIVTTAPATFPNGLTLNPSTGAITGTPTLAGVFNFTVGVTDSTPAAPLSTTKPFQITINAAPVPPTITTVSPLPGGTTGTPYPLLTFTNINGTPGFTWVVTNPAQLPPGLSVAPNGNLTGTPTLAGTYNFNVQVTDSLALSDAKVFQLKVVDPLVITTPTPLAASTVNLPGYSQTLNATGGTAPYNNWIVTLGSLPTGLTLSAAAGTITGTPTAAGTFNFTVQVSDSGALTTTKAFAITINPAVVITTATPLPAGNVLTPYPVLTFAATGGTPAYGNWIVTVGSLPPGLNLAAPSGDLTGTPTTAGVYNFTVSVTDSVGSTATKAFSLTVTASLAITTATPLPGGTVLVPYPLLTFAATGGTPAYNNWIVTVGALPPGLNLAAGTGALTGTPTTAGVFNFTVQVSDSLAATATKAFSLTVGPALSITTATPLPGGTVLVPYPLLTFAATGGTAPYNNWLVTVGSLPPGLNLAAGTGALTGTPTTAGVYNFTVSVTDSVATVATKAFSLTVVAPLSITTATPLPGGTVLVPYPLLTFAATGGTPAYSNWIVTVGSLPPGLNLAAATGALTGTPTTPGVFNFTVQVSDSLAVTATKAFSLTVVGPLTITTATPLPGGTVLVPYPLLTFAAAGGTSPYNNWIVTVGSLPPGLNLAAGTGALTGTPTTAGVYNFTVQVTDAVAATTTKAFSLTVGTPLSITTATPLPGGTVLVPYPLLTFAATGGTPAYSNWIVTVGSLPPGLSLAAGTGALTGTPTTAGVYNFTVQVSDSLAVTATKAFSLTVGPALAITTATPLPGGAVSVAYPLLTFAATGGTPAYNNWIVTVGTLPPGLSLAAATGALTGTPTTPGVFNFTVQVSDSVATTATKAFSLTVIGPLTITTATPLPGGTVLVPYPLLTFAAAGGTSPYNNWIVTVGTLPPGLNLTAATGALTGTPTTAGVYNFTVQVTDAVAATATKAFSLTVTTPPSITTTSPLPGGVVGTAYTQTFAATGGTPPYVNWVVTAGTLPPGLVLTAATGVLAGTPTSAVGSPFSFTIQVTDTAAGTATKAFTLAVTPQSCASGASPSGAGTINACVTGGGSTCALSSGSGQFIPLTGGAGSPPAGSSPAGILFPFGLFAFQLTGCTPGSTVTMVVTYPSAIPAGSVYYKYGPQPSQPTPSWYVLPATLVGNTATFSITDGGLGDDDLTANGTIVDPGGPGVAGGPGTVSTGGAIQTPTLSEWALMLLTTLVLLAGLGRVRRRRA